MNDPYLDVFESDASIEDCVRWICFLRGYCAIYGPANIYTYVPIPRSHRLSSKMYAISVPIYISNILAEYFERLREQARISRDLAIDSINPVDEHLLTRYQHSVFRRSQVAYRQHSALRLGALLTSVVQSEMRLSAAEAIRWRTLVATQYNAFGYALIEASGLYADENLWVRDHMRGEEMRVAIRLGL